MNSVDNKRVGVAFLAALAGLLAALALVAGPAAGLDSGGANASDDSVASGAAVARNDSVASGDAVAIDDSASSGCATARDDSTASGGVCPPPAAEIQKEKLVTRRAVPSAQPARAQRVSKLAFTGPGDVVPLVAVGGGLLLTGVLLTSLASDQRRRVLGP